VHDLCQVLSVLRTHFLNLLLSLALFTVYVCLLHATFSLEIERISSVFLSKVRPISQSWRMQHLSLSLTLETCLTSGAEILKLSVATHNFARRRRTLKTAFISVITIIGIGQRRFRSLFFSSPLAALAFCAAPLRPGSERKTQKKIPFFPSMGPLATFVWCCQGGITRSSTAAILNYTKIMMAEFDFNSPLSVKIVKVRRLLLKFNGNFELREVILMFLNSVVFSGKLCTALLEDII